MATTTPNFGWSVSTSTDLVKDGATAIETLGDAIDASLVDLKGGTTGQILSKNSNTDMDFTWVSETGDISGVTAGTGITGGGTSGNVTITNDMATSIDAKGDLIAGTAADTYARLAVGTNGQVLTANSSTATGLEWQNSASISNWTLLNAGGTALTGATTITVSSLSAKQLLILIDAASAGSGDQIRIRFNSDSAQNYTQLGQFINPQSTYANTVPSGVSNYSNLTQINFCNLANNAASTGDGAIFVDLADKTGNHFYDMISAVNTATGTDPGHYITKGLYEGSAAITSVSIISSGSNFDAGTIYIWGAN